MTREISPGPSDPRGARPPKAGAGGRSARDVRAAAEQAERDARRARAEAQQARREAQKAEREAQKAVDAAERAALIAKGDAERAMQQAAHKAAQKVARKTAQKTAQKEARKSAHKGARTSAADAARQAQKPNRHADLIEHIAGHLSVLDLWTREEPAGRRPRFSREEIAAAAVRIADQEGFAAVSMRHLAADLGAGTMTLYHYVRTKDELLTLVVDAVMGEVVIPPDEPLPEDWRAAISVIAHRSRASLQRHPWILDITDDPPFGPNSVRHFDQTLEAVSSLAIPLGEKLDIVTCIDEYVFGHCLHQRNNVAVDDDLVSDEVAGYVEGLVASGEYPQLAELATTHGLEEVWDQIAAHQRDDGRFDRNLQRLLDGIEAGLPPGAAPTR